jgi:hypothetical protein
MSLPARALARNCKNEDFPTPGSPTTRMVYVLTIPLRDPGSLVNTVSRCIGAVVEIIAVDDGDDVAATN